MLSPPTLQIENEIQYPQYKVITISVLMSICGALGAYHAFSLQERQDFLYFKNEIQLSKQDEISDMQTVIQKYSEIHTQENLQVALPELFAEHETFDLKGQFELHEKIMTINFQGTSVDITLLRGTCFLKGNVLEIPILIQDFQQLGLWVYEIDFSEHKMYDADQIKTSIKEDGKTLNSNEVDAKNTTEEYIEISFEYPLPKWKTPKIYSEDIFVQKSFDVIAFLAYWESLQKIRHDPSLMIRLNHHITEMMWEETQGRFHRTSLLESVTTGGRTLHTKDSVTTIPEEQKKRK